MAAVVPEPMTSNPLPEGRFDKRDFLHDVQNVEYRCPAGRIAIYRCTTEVAGQTLHKCWSSDCPQGPMKSRCTTGMPIGTGAALLYAGSARRRPPAA